MDDKIKIMIVDDDINWTEGLKFFLEKDMNAKVIKTTTSYVLMLIYLIQM
jgi:hypothetical protein